jgi:inositol-1,4,5-trisphosphate 5-phosphatase
MTLHKTPTVSSMGTEPLRFLIITQNIGTLDPCDSKGVPDRIKLLTSHFLDSARTFLETAARAKRNHVSLGSSATVQVPSSQHCIMRKRGYSLASQKSLSLSWSMAAPVATPPEAGHPAAQPDVECTDGVLRPSHSDCKDDVAESLDIVVIHVQEIGGKKHHQEFNEYLASRVREIWPGAGWCSGLLMQPQNCDSTFTAIGTIAFISPRVVPITSVLSIKHRTYVAVSDDPITYAGSQNYLFHGLKFSNAERSRKGYLLFSIRVGTQCINLLNTHLYHDADNLEAVSATPSKFSDRRTDAFLEMLNEVLPVVDPRDPLFIFGDLNTRLDGKGLLAYLLEHNVVKEGDVVFGKKEVTAPPVFWEYFHSPQHRQILQKFDIEPRRLIEAAHQHCGLELCEFPVRFSPTYLRQDQLLDTGVSTEELERMHASNTKGITIGETKNRAYSTERVPAWCDRIFLNAAAVRLIGSLSESGLPRDGEEKLSSQYVYDSVSLEEMDHEAVFLLC